MNAAYVDTSVLVAISFAEPAAVNMARELSRCDRLFSSNLLEAELRAAFWREKVPFHELSVAGIEWVLPSRPLTSEFTRALSSGYLRGADLWHVATALYLSSGLQNLFFATLDARQRSVVSALGLQVLDARDQK